MARHSTTRGRSSDVPQTLFDDGQKEKKPVAKKETGPQAAARPRRTKQPAVYYRLTVRLSHELDDRVTVANTISGKGPQQIGHEAINDYATALGVPAEVPTYLPKDRPSREMTRFGRPGERLHEVELPQFAIRVTPLTDARFTEVCRMTGSGPQVVLQTALNVWMYKNAIPATLPDEAAA